jgi:uncharacterized membrane protein
MDSFHRSLAKTITWRVVATAITLAVVYAFTGSLGEASVITLTAAVLLAIGYYFHERAWERTHWGRRVTRSARSAHARR